MNKLLSLAAVAVFSAFAPSVFAQQAGVELGILDCTVEGGAGFIIGSSKDVVCTFTPANAKFAPETYAGVVNKIGLDIGVTGTTLIKWVVLASSDNIYAPGALAGDYVGASAGASVAVGAGANFLIGGSKATFTLQPLSVQAQTGVNLAVGIASFRLRSTAG